MKASRVSGFRRSIAQVFFSSDGRGVRFRDVALIPEPGSVFLFLAGGLSLGVLRRRLPRA